MATWQIQYISGQQIKFDYWISIEFKEHKKHPHPVIFSIFESSDILLSVKVGQLDLQLVILLAGQVVDPLKAKPALP